MTTNNTVTVTINNPTITGDLATIAALLNLQVESADKAPKAKAPKAPKENKPEAAKRAKVEAKMETRAKKSARVEAAKSKHDAILDTKRVDRMVKTAIDKFTAANIEVKSSKQGKWVWIYPMHGEGRTDEFKAVKLAKGWKHSMKRGAFFRDFSA